MFRSQPSCARSFTLVEVLVALALTALLLSIVGPIATGALRSRNAASDIAARIHRESAVIDSLENDLRRLLDGLSEHGSSVRVFGFPQQTLELDVLGVVHEKADALHEALYPSTVRYRLMRTTDSENNLVRESHDHTNASAKTQRETLASHITLFEVEVFDGRSWLRSFPDPRKSSTKGVQALRIRMAWRNSPEPITHTLGVSHVP
ncbi:MAG: prepilin-type N-terminal cleavage/methylation domain-containing protein [Planctomycetota bacterium]